MKFECGDLERALAVPELMEEVRTHLRDCAECRKEFRLWNEISSAARELHEEWESPELWGRIRQSLAIEEKQRQPIWWRDWRIWSIAATILIGICLLWRPWSHFGVNQTASNSEDREFLTDQALREVEQSEAAYRKSIDKLYRLAEPKIERADSPLTVSYREKLMVIDSAIADVRTNLDRNRLNSHLQMELATLYREKQQTLEELLTRDQKN